MADSRTATIRIHTIIFAGLALSVHAASAAPALSLTLEQADGLLHGIMPIDVIPGRHVTVPAGAQIGAGYIPGASTLGIPALKETDASLGVAWALGLRRDGATALPSGLAAAASFSPDMAIQAGAMIAREARAKGFNVVLAGGANLARDPRSGRNFEYVGEDPLLAGTMAGASVRGIESEHVISTVKHFAFNDIESGRNFHNAVIAEAAARESDLLAFEIAIQQGHPGAIMCAYNRVNGPYACANDWLLNKVLKQDWRFPGWVMSDWGAVHATDAILAGLDQESGEQLDDTVWFGATLLDKAAGDPAYKARMMDAAQRIVGAMRQIGVADQPPGPAPDWSADEAVAQRAAEAGIVLLQNNSAILPLPGKIANIAVIGGHADTGTLSGGGSSQVVGRGGPNGSFQVTGAGLLGPSWDTEIFNGSSPLTALRAAAPGANITFTTSRYPSQAAEAARGADVAIIFATQWNIENEDLPDLSLPDGQDAVIAAVAAANTRTIVVLETGNPVLMPWRDKVAGIVEAWYPGARGGEAIARVLFGNVNPSGRLPISFPASLSQLPRPINPGLGKFVGQSFDVNYTEGSDVGYKWYAGHNLKPLYPFGFGLSYTKFRYSLLEVSAGDTPHFSFSVTNTGARAGTDTPQVYLQSAPRRKQERLLGWSRVTLQPGETRQVEITADPRVLANWSDADHGWKIDAGTYSFNLGTSASDDGANGKGDVERTCFGAVGSKPSFLKRRKPRRPGAKNFCS